MLTLERHESILNRLREKGSVRVADLAVSLQVTEETIRRDLQKLEDAGKLRRSHGGAVLADAQTKESPYWWREVANEKEKARIALEAIKRIEAGQTILLDASTTCWHMAKRLPNQPLTVITHSVQIVEALAKADRIEVITPGGRLSRKSMSFLGPAAERQLHQLHADQVFISGAGVDPQAGVTDASDAQASLRALMLQRAGIKRLLADHTKFGKTTLTRVAGLDQFDEIITDRGLPDEMLDQLRKLNINPTLV